MAVAPMPSSKLEDGTFIIGRDAFPDFGRLARLGVHIQSDRVRVAQAGSGVRPGWHSTRWTGHVGSSASPRRPSSSSTRSSRRRLPGSATASRAHTRPTTRRSSGCSRTGRVSTNCGRSSDTRLPTSRLHDPHSRGVSRSLRTVGGLRAGIRAGSVIWREIGRDRPFSGWYREHSGCPGMNALKAPRPEDTWAATISNRTSDRPLPHLASREGAGRDACRRRRF